ncbi:MAG: glucuronyl hydrolase [Bacteroidales bacterium]|nr:glucuronyl hydrolase [Bacteroidales bacterium]
MKRIVPFAFALILISLPSCRKKVCFQPDPWLRMAHQKVVRTLQHLPDTARMPRMIPQGERKWKTVGIYDWTSGFWPGILWYMAEYSGDSGLLNRARHWTAYLEPVKKMPEKNHDLGFMMYCSFGNGFRITGDSLYKQILLETADSLVTLFNPSAGTILSWPWQRKNRGWKHNTIIDNMMNLELLFWAAGNGRPQYKEIAITHALTTMKNQIRPDNSVVHVVVYDDETGKVDSLKTWQGANDESMWARGQAWGIYGFTMCYRETGMKEFLTTAQHLADHFIERLPADRVPYWDFDAPGIPNEPKDASAAAIAASALVELSSFTPDKDKASFYLRSACHILASLTGHYLAPEESDAILDHSVGSKPQNSEVDVPIIYADYYFIEALMRLRNITPNYSLGALRRSEPMDYLGLSRFRKITFLVQRQQTGKVDFS